ncbi:MAG: hypothetical protein AAFQ57_16535, partial [Cyanobacteria bacterium J06626_14]
MNATLVEIQRIQTRLQKLGRPQSVSDSSMQADTLSLPDTPSPQTPAKPIVNQGRANSSRSVSRFYSSPHREVITSSPPDIATEPYRSSSGPQTDLLKPQADGLSHNHQESYALERLNQSNTNAVSATDRHRSNRRVAQEVANYLAQQAIARDESRSQSHSTDAEHDNRHQPYQTQQSVEHRYAAQQGAIASEAPIHYSHAVSPQITEQSSLKANDSVSSQVRQQQHHNGQQTYRQSVQNTFHPAGVKPTLPQMFQQLNLQAQHINAMSSSLNQALAELKAIAEQMDHQRVLEAASGHSASLPDMLCFLRSHQQEFLVPYVTQLSTGELVVEASSIRPEQFDSRQTPPSPSAPVGSRSTGVALSQGSVSKRQQSTASDQHRISDSRRQKTSAPLEHWLKWLVGLERISTSSPQASSTAVQERVSKPVEGPRAPHASSLKPTHLESADSASPPNLGQSLMWIGGSALIRICLDSILLVYPALWPLAIALVVTPAAIAIYRTVIDSSVSFALGRRLILIMIGLLVGGR